jgi:hypothetical protein
MGEAARPAIPQIEKALNDSEPHIRLNAAHALWRMDRQKHIVSILKDRLESEENWDRLSLINPVSSRIFLLNTAKELEPGCRAHPRRPTAACQTTNSIKPSLIPAPSRWLALPAMRRKTLLDRNVTCVAMAIPEN